MTIIRSIDAQIFKWFGDACSLYQVHNLPRYVVRKVLYGARFFLATKGAFRARSFVYRKVSRYWQTLNTERIAEFIAQYRADGESSALARAA